MNSPKLVYHQDFEDILSDYQASDYVRELLHKTNALLITSATSSGRNTIIKELIKTGKYLFIVSDTTRPKRMNNGVIETDGVEYNFITEDKFLEGLKKGDYLEAAIIHNQQVSGVSVGQVESAHRQNEVAVFEIDIAGVSTVYALKPNSYMIFVLPPSYDEWMRRFATRGVMFNDEYRNRMKSAERELEDALSNPDYQFVINDDLHDTVILVRKMVEEDFVDDIYQQKAKDLAWKLVNEIKGALSS